MTAVVTLRNGAPGRHYRLPTSRDYEAVRRAHERLETILKEWDNDGRIDHCPLPNEPTPVGGGPGAGRAFGVQRYGILQWADLFMARQKVALITIGKALSDTSTLVRPLSLSMGKLADLANTVCPWEPKAECPRNVLSNGRLKPAWDFAEGVPTSESSGSFAKCLENLAKGIKSVQGVRLIGQTEVAPAQNSPLPNDAASVWFTDPPYYDAIPYADLSDFFFVWYKRFFPEQVRPDPFDGTNPLTPKALEAVHDESRNVDGRAKDRQFFEDAMAQAFSDGNRVVRRDGIASVVFAHKTTEGWEALLSGIIRGGWTITGSWPVATEQPHRLRARESAALATSVHLVLRPRAEDAPIGDWSNVLRELPLHVAAWMHRLQGERIRGADLVFACVGPALEIFSQYRSVETAEGSEVDLAEYLEKVWEVVGRAALREVLGADDPERQESAAGTLEEDARLTALFLWTLQSSDLPTENGDPGADETAAVAKKAAKGFTLPFDVVRRFAQPMGISLDAWNGRVIAQKKGVVRLLPVTERARDLFGEDGTAGAAAWIEHDSTASLQQVLFPEAAGAAKPRSNRMKSRNRRGRAIRLDTDLELDAAAATTLDRVHAAMLLQSSGHTNALRRLIETEQERGPDFLRLADALTALYPRGSAEKRLLEAMLVAVPR